MGELTMAVDNVTVLTIKRKDVFSALQMLDDRIKNRLNFFHKMFSKCTREAIEAFILFLQEKEYKKNHTLYEEDEQPSKFYMLL